MKDPQDCTAVVMLSTERLRQLTNGAEPISSPLHQQFLIDVGNAYLRGGNSKKKKKDLRNCDRCNPDVNGGK